MSLGAAQIGSSADTTGAGMADMADMAGPRGRELMEADWSDNQPIYRQLRDRVVAMILEGVLKDGDALPSVRNVAAEYRLNPLTVLKGYQELVDEDLVEKRRGRGMYVLPGARDRLLKGERERFLEQEWPEVVATMQRLELDPADLLARAEKAKSEGSDES